MIDREEVLAWLRLLETPGVGRVSARRLLAAFASPQGVFAASHAARCQVVGATVAEPLRGPAPQIDELSEATCRWLEADDRCGLLLLGDADYPASLLASPDPPLLLYLQGNRHLLANDSLAVVGSRNPTPQGTENARAFAREVSRAGYTIVSGMALGIDTAAHRGGLEGGASSIAVVGTGLDLVYPTRNHELAHRLAQEGLLVSEYSLGTPPLAARFPQRNRVIAGLSLGTLVVEAALHSGSLITARLATEAGRDVFAVPGSIHSPQSRGCHQLIKQGAQLVDSAGDVLDALAPVRRRGAVGDRPAEQSDGKGAAALPPPIDDGASEAATGTDPQASLLAALGHEATSLDSLIARTGCSAQELNARLLELELVGRVARLPGQLFQRIGLA